MATTIHIPDDLLERIDRRAHELKISRNRYIVEALHRTLANQDEWPLQFLDNIRSWSSDPEGASEAVNEMVAEILAHRRSRRGRPL